MQDISSIKYLGIDLDGTLLTSSKQIDNETSFDYWMRTLNVILDTDGTPQQILNHPNKTYPAYRWACIVNSGYLAFWDATNDRDEFVITDIGMTSENEKGWDGIRIHNRKKIEYIESLLKSTIDSNERDSLLNLYLIQFQALVRIFKCSRYHQNV